MFFNISKPVENKNDNIAWWGLELCRCHAYVIYNKSIQIIQRTQERKNRKMKNRGDIQ